MDRAGDPCPVWGPLGRTHDLSPYNDSCLKCGRPLAVETDEEAGAAARLDDDATANALRARPGGYRRLGRVGTRCTPLPEQCPLEPDPEDDP